MSPKRKASVMAAKSFTADEEEDLDGEDGECDGNPERCSFAREVSEVTYPLVKMYCEHLQQVIHTGKLLKTVSQKTLDELIEFLDGFVGGHDTGSDFVLRAYDEKKNTSADESAAANAATEVVKPGSSSSWQIKFQHATLSTRQSFFKQLTGCNKDGSDAAITMTPTEWTELRDATREFSGDALLDHLFDHVCKTGTTKAVVSASKSLSSSSAAAAASTTAVAVDESESEFEGEGESSTSEEEDDDEISGPDEDEDEEGDESEDEADPDEAEDDDDGGDVKAQQPSPKKKKQQQKKKPSSSTKKKSPAAATVVAVAAAAAKKKPAPLPPPSTSKKPKTATSAVKASKAKANNNNNNLRENRRSAKVNPVGDEEEENDDNEGSSSSPPATKKQKMTPKSNGMAMIVDGDSD